MSRLTVALLSVVAVLGIICWHLWGKTARLDHNMAEAAKELRLQAADKKASEDVLKKQQDAEHAIQAARKEREKQLEGGACLTGDEHIDYLLRLLDEDAEARCGTASGDAAGSL